MKCPICNTQQAGVQFIRFNDKLRIDEEVIRYDCGTKLAIDRFVYMLYRYGHSEISLDKYDIVSRCVPLKRYMVYRRPSERELLEELCQKKRQDI